MKIENKFYIGKSQSDYMTYGYYYNIADGEYAQGDNCFIMFQTRLNGAKRIRIETPFYNLNEDRACVLFWDENNVYLGFQDKELSTNGTFESDVPYTNAFYFGFYIAKRDYSGSTSQKDIKVYFYIPINPHYKQLKKKYAKENNQVFFRESIDGKINLFGSDYLLIKNASLEDTLYFYVYRGDNLFASASFNKSDCKFDHARKGVELKLTYDDKYSKILDAYENTYDLIKLAPALTPITLTKRCVVQIYIQGENTISNYAGGTYWETEVDEQIDDENQLLHHYYFAKGPKYVEIDLQGFNYNINSAYRGIPNNDVWNAVSSVDYIDIWPISVSAWEQGSISSADGSNMSNGTMLRCRTAGYIDITGANSLNIISKAIPGNLYAYYDVYFYDSSKNFISNINTWISGGNISIPNNAKYLRLLLRPNPDGGFQMTPERAVNAGELRMTSIRDGRKVLYKVQSYIKFNKIFDADTIISGNVYTIHLMSTGQGSGVDQVEGGYRVLYDTYQIEIYETRDGLNRKIYQSSRLYGKDKDFTLASGEDLYPMLKVGQSTPYVDPVPSDFNLGESVIEYQVWGRLLCDVDQVPSHEQGHEGEMIDTYDLPRDDFATPRRNYRKCIGLRGFDSANSVVSIWQYEGTSEFPTSYGMNDFGEYFIWPYTLNQQYFYPLARSSWANVSLWVKLGIVDITSFESFCAECYKEYNIKDTYHIGDVIKALLAKIDPSIKHEKTAEYSSFLYGHSGGTASVLGNCDLYITQKTNILKGEYDQAAQKAEIKFKQLMDMLRDCFRCFWYIDDQNRFRIEHVSYFMKGLSYNNPVVQLDLTIKKDKFNKKAALYCQQEIEYDKSDLISRYEFKYMDDVTKAMGGDLYVDVNNKYIKKDKTEEINIDGFTADIDYMLFLPDDFSNDGFALLLANSSKKVPIISQRIKDEKQNNHYFDVYVQNWYASFNEMIWHYMEDLSGNSIDFNNLDYLYVNHVKRCMKHDIEFHASELAIDVYKLIKTDIGNGYIEEVTTNIDTDMTDVELRYEPG